MKKILIYLFLSIWLFAEDKLTEEIQKQFEVLNKISKEKIFNKVNIKYDPFFSDEYNNNQNTKQNINSIKNRKNSSNFSQKKILETFSKPILEMILNKNAFINGKWVKEKDFVADYKILKIDENYVILSRKNRKIILKIHNKLNLFLRRKR